MDVVISVPDEIADEWSGNAGASGLSHRLQVELALHLYATGRLSLGRSAELSGLARGAFETELAEAGIERNYASEELETDLAWVEERRNR